METVADYLSSLDGDERTKFRAAINARVPPPSQGRRPAERLFNWGVEVVQPAGFGPRSSSRPDAGSRRTSSGRRNFVRDGRARSSDAGCDFSGFAKPMRHDIPQFWDVTGFPSPGEGGETVKESDARARLRLAGVTATNALPKSASRETKTCGLRLSAQRTYNQRLRPPTGGHRPNSQAPSRGNVGLFRTLGNYDGFEPEIRFSVLPTT